MHPVMPRKRLTAYAPVNRDTSQVGLWPTGEPGIARTPVTQRIVKILLFCAFLALFFGNEPGAELYVVSGAEVLVVTAAAIGVLMGQLRPRGLGALESLMLVAGTLSIFSTLITGDLYSARFSAMFLVVLLATMALTRS